MAQNASQEPVVEGEHDWIFDCLITFLKSPRWKTPVVSFIEEHCLIFDHEEENKLEYTTIHMNFFRLVDELLCELVAEMGINREQFKAACESSATNPTHHRIVQQILSVDDFESFKKMMIKKNMQINEICMSELMKKTSSAQESSVEEIQASAQEIVQKAQQEFQTQVVSDEDEQMRLVMEMSRADAEQADKASKEEEEMIRQAIEASQAEEAARAQQVQQEDAKTMAAIAESQIQAQAPVVAVQAPVVKEEVKQPEPQAADESIVSPQDKPVRQRITANIDPEQQRREDEKIRQLAELKRRNAEAKNQPKQVQQPLQKAQPVVPQKVEPKVDNSKFLEEQKEVISKIRKPNVEEVSAFDDAFSGAAFRQAEDPYAGKSFAEVLRLKREKLDAQLKASQPVPAPVQEQAQAAEVPQEPPIPKATGKDETLEDRKARLQAQRAAILEKRKQAREKELNEYNTSANGAQLDAARNSFYAQMIKMDQALPSKGLQPVPQAQAQQLAPAQGQQQKPVQAAQAQPAAPQRAAFNLDDIEAMNVP